MLGFEYVTKLIKSHVTNITPRAYMLVRTLISSFIIFDKIYNTITEKMKMLLTSIGFCPIAWITKEVTQVYFPKIPQSGLSQIIDDLKDVAIIIFTHFMPNNVARREMVQRSVQD